MIRYPNGYIIETDPPENAFFVYGELNAAGYIAKGFRLDVPNSPTPAGRRRMSCIRTCNRICRGSMHQSGFNSATPRTRITGRFWKNTNPIRSVWRMYRSAGNSESRPLPSFGVGWRIMNSGGNI